MFNDVFLGTNNGDVKNQKLMSKFGTQVNVTMQGICLGADITQEKLGRLKINNKNYDLSASEKFVGLVNIEYVPGLSGEFVAWNDNTTDNPKTIGPLGLNENDISLTGYICEPLECVFKTEGGANLVLANGTLSHVHINTNSPRAGQYNGFHAALKVGSKTYTSQEYANTLAFFESEVYEFTFYIPLAEQANIFQNSESSTSDKIYAYRIFRTTPDYNLQ